MMKSTLAAETLALLEVAESDYYFGKIMGDIGIGKKDTQKMLGG